MTRLIATAIIGVLTGVAGTMLVLGRHEPMPDGDRGIVARAIGNVPKMTVATAAAHRKLQYENLHTIEDVLALPTDFARSEALYALAGRADSGAVQHLAHEANRISSDDVRKSTLTILFSRLAELDARSALALSRTATFAGDRDNESRVWASWGKLDLDAALRAAAAESSRSRRYRAAQSLYAAFGYLGNATTERIENDLGIPPNDSVRARYLYNLADRSVADAIAYITNLPSRREQQQLTYWLAYHLSRGDPDNASIFATLFSDLQLRETFHGVVATVRGAADPQEVLESLLGGTVPPARQGELYGAMRELASRDIDSAIRYFDQARNEQNRQIFGSLIASELSRQDPARAIEWAQSNDPGNRSHLLQGILMEIASSDPQLAFSEASRIGHATLRSSAISTVVRAMAATDAAVASSYVEKIEKRRERESAATSVFMQWSMTDPDAAIDWLLSSDTVESRTILQRTGRQLVHRDLDAAIRLLPRIDARNAASLSLQIAEQLAAQRSVGDALGFISRFEGAANYSRLQAAVAGGVAKYDVFAAKQIADQLPPGSGKDQAYAKLIHQQAQTDPMQAATWLRSIADDKKRQNAAARLAGLWQAQDPDAALRWAGNLPRGLQRDNAIASLVSGWRDELTPGQQRLIASIGDAEKRNQAWTTRIGVIARLDPEQARNLLNEANLPDDARRRLESMIDDYENDFWE